MTINTIAINSISKKIAEGMYQGNMHNCLRDAGRMIGGYLANSYISAAEADALMKDAISRCIDKKLGTSTIRKAVDDGGKVPLDIDFCDFESKDRAFGFDDPLVRVKRKAHNDAVLQPLKKDPPPEFVKVVDTGWLAKAEVPPAPIVPGWQADHFTRYINAMFLPHETVGLCINTWSKETDDGVKFLPDAGFWDRTAKELVDLLKKKKGNLAAVLGDHNKDAGAWVRINPMDGQGAKDVNVTQYRHALIEGDGDELGKQLQIIKDLQLPCSCIVHSGKKSIHALVRVCAKNLDEYRERVDYLHGVVNCNGLKADSSTKNPSRLSRLPGFERAGGHQYLIDEKCGMPDWESWVDWIEDKKDDLPEFESLEDVDFDNLPEKAPELIEGILREGRKMTLTGPSKAGKSFDLMELSIAIACGTKWHDRRCKQGKVLYINAELDKIEAIHREKDLFVAKNIDYVHRKNIDFWHLRGKNRPLNLLAPKLIRRAKSRGYKAIIIDPIYKLLTGDENNAADMSAFTNLFDKIASELGCAVICCHHHSKGDQGGKQSTDRGSGSGVFTRDPDAILDLIELTIKPDAREQVIFVHSINTMVAAAKEAGINLMQYGDAETDNPEALFMALSTDYPQHASVIRAARATGIQQAKGMSGWRIEATLREFAKPDNFFTWFVHPVHCHDFVDILKDAKVKGEEPAWMADKEKKNQQREEKKRKAEERKRQEEEDKKHAQRKVDEDEQARLFAAIKRLGGFGVVTKQELEAELRLSDYQFRTLIRKHGVVSRRTGEGRNQALFGTL